MGLDRPSPTMGVGGASSGKLRHWPVLSRARTLYQFFVRHRVLQLLVVTSLIFALDNLLSYPVEWTFGLLTTAMAAAHAYQLGASVLFLYITFTIALDYIVRIAFGRSY